MLLRIVSDNLVQFELRFVRFHLYRVERYPSLYIFSVKKKKEEKI